LHRTRRFAITLGVGGLLLGAAEATAQRWAVVGETEIGHYGGALLADDVVTLGESTPLADPQVFPGPPIDALTVRDGTTFGLRLLRNRSEHISWEVFWGYSFSELRRTGPGENGRREEVPYDRLGIVEYGVALLWHPVWLAEERLGPHVRVGAGGVGWRPANDFPDRARPLATGRTSSLAGMVGAGLTFYATEDLVFRGEYSYTRSTLDRDALLRLDFPRQTDADEVVPFPPVGDTSMGFHRVEIGFHLRLFDTTL
jgi:hypothetical protein